MSTVAATTKVLRWRLEPDRHARRRGFDLWWGDYSKAECVLHVRYAPRHRTYYFHGWGGRNSLLAGERYGSMADAKTAGRKWVRGEIKGKRLF